MLVKAVFRQMEFGMTAGLPNLSCLPTQKTKEGIKAPERARSAMFGGWWIVETLEVIIAKTYDNIAMHALAITMPPSQFLATGAVDDDDLRSVLRRERRRMLQQTLKH